MKSKKQKKLTITVRVGDSNETGDTPQEQFFFNIVNTVTDLISKGMNDKDLKLDYLHPRTMIAIVTANIIINLFNEAAHSASTETKMAMLDSLLDEIRTVTVQGYNISFNNFERMKSEQH